MRKRMYLLAAVSAVLGMASFASADINVSTLRWANPDLAGYDSVALFALNDGTGVDFDNGTAYTGLLLVNCTITDKSSSGVVPGVYAQGSKASNTAYTGDPSGSHIFATGTFYSPNSIPVYGTTGTYPGDNSSTNSSELYSWIGDGGIHGGSAIATSTPIVVTSALGGPISDTGYASAMSSLMAEVYWQNAIPGTAGASGGGASSTLGAWVALAVVPHGDVVEFSGVLGSNSTNSLAGPRSYDITNPTGPVPEPASLGVLTLGTVALMARRRRR